MNEDFEQRLRRQPPRALPPAWRAEILVAADVSRRKSSTSTRGSFRAIFAGLLYQLSTKDYQLRWSALAAIWLVIFALNHSARDTSSAALAKAVPPSPQMMLVLREQKKLLAELIGPATEGLPADRPKPAPPGPHSQRQEETTTI